MKSNKKKRRTKKKKQSVKIRNIVFSFILLILVFSLGIAGYVFSLILKSEHTEVPIVESHSVPDGLLDDLVDPEDTDNNTTSQTSDTTASVTPTPIYWTRTERVKVYVDDRFPIIKVEQKDDDIENILLFGVDSRSPDQKTARADSIVIVSIDQRNNCIKLTSILRDTQVTIPGRTLPGKINSSYVFGGIGLLINTINQNFDLDIQKFAMVDMWSAEKIIDALGGITIRIEENEVDQVNLNIRVANGLFSKIEEPVPYITSSGLVLLNGRQAVAYARIRKIGSDIQRTERQRRVLSELIKQFKNTSLSNKLAAVDELAKSFETNIPKSEMPFFAVDILSSMQNIAQYRIPASGNFTTNTQNWNLIIDMDKQIPELHAFIWGDEVADVTPLPEEDSKSSTASSSFSADTSDIINSQDSSDQLSEESEVGSNGSNDSEYASTESFMSSAVSVPSYGSETSGMSYESLISSETDD